MYSTLRQTVILTKYVGIHGIFWGRTISKKFGPFKSSTAGRGDTHPNKTVRSVRKMLVDERKLQQFTPFT